MAIIEVKCQLLCLRVSIQAQCHSTSCLRPKFHSRRTEILDWRLIGVRCVNNTTSSRNPNATGESKVFYDMQHPTEDVRRSPVFTQLPQPIRDGVRSTVHFQPSPPVRTFFWSPTFRLSDLKSISGRYDGNGVL